MKKKNEVLEYDKKDFSADLSRQKPKKLKDIGVNLPEVPPSQVLSIRLPTSLLNDLRATGSSRDIPYQAIIKELLFEGLKRYKKRA